MSLRKIFAIVMQEIYLSRRSLEVIIDVGFFSLINTIVFGFVGVWLAGTSNNHSAYYLLIGLNFWNVVNVTSYSVAVGSLWNIWSRSLSSIFVAPISVTEYLTAHVLSALLKALVITLMTSLITTFMFHFNVFALGGINLFFIFINLFIFATSVGFFVLGLIFRFGTRIQAFAWSVSSLFEPLTAALYPLKVLPPFLQTIARTLPPTYVFEATRATVIDSKIHWDMHITALALNVIYLVSSIVVFYVLFKKSKESGQFAKNED